MADRVGNKSPRSWASEQGDVVVEYVILVGVVAIPMIPALIAAGVWAVGLFENMRNMLIVPVP